MPAGDDANKSLIPQSTLSPDEYYEKQENQFFPHDVLFPKKIPPTAKSNSTESIMSRV